jgi:hypothetical protein
MRSLRNFFSKGKDVTPSFIGFRHPSGIGVRSKYYAVPLSRGASGFTRALAEDAALTFIENSTQSSDVAGMKDFAETFLPQLARHRNTAGIFIVAVGDETTTAQEVSALIQSSGTVCEYLVISDCRDMEVATNLAIATAQELKSMALSGIDRIESCDLTITYRDEPTAYPELLALLEKSGFTVNSRKVQGERAKYLAEAATDGAHVILSFLAPDEYPTGTLVTPVINIASHSQMHQVISSECDLQADATHEEIVNSVSMAFGMVPTHTEAVGIIEPLFTANVATLNDEDGEGEICLLPAHPALNSFLIDIVTNQAGFFLRDYQNLSLGSLQAKKILVIGTGGAEDRFADLLATDARVQKLTVSQSGSLRELAGRILSHL